MHHKKIVLQYILTAIASILAAAVGFCVVPVWSYLAGRATPLEETYLAAGMDYAVNVDISDETVQNLLNGNVTLDEVYAQADLVFTTAPAQGGSSNSVGATEPDSSHHQEENGKVPESTETANGAGSASGENNAASSGAQSNPPTEGAAYEQEVKALIQQLYGVKARAESGLNQCIQSAYSEYMALPANQRTQAKKISICFSKAGQLSSLQASCDKEVNQIIREMRQILTSNGQSTALADSAEATYKSEKSAMYSTLMKRLYS